ncbi:UDP-N-acetylglucosamine 2-epimerase [Bacteroides ovatus]|uniref:UDP-N-acetylglucosamine 2-epimerase n=1 Tax=Bacteroides ovatus TaxID=28116 RepID=UPI0018974BFA|nr:UDP-N-acetylglucosamine 2-epimerase [Bacteroides ovatus]MDC2625155.1 UDP-N-acetylglucosamine 2-epimerase [Bacteroides ovatus]MDC2639066.1 UDP-N-acetylglucosamine 2-epimerase [Bacteroides ovatus]MDC2652355.1 UDP-N-acetylglucosamine 2-epimerase [Bacteroides ovatus]
MRKICFITGTRAEYGLLSRLMRLVNDSEACELQVIATNMHLMPEYGNTYKEIETDGFIINEKVLMPKPSDDAAGVLDSMVTELDGMSKALQRLVPDMAVILGDRYEMHIAATVCMLLRIPIAHLHGGEVSEGAVDDSIRHCITKMSSLHFTSTEEYRKRVIQLGEQPDRVFNVGSIGVENLKRVSLMSKEELEASLDYQFDENTVMCTYHPVTLGSRTPADEIKDFLAALDEFPQMRVLFTMPNSDQGGDTIRKAIEDYCAKNSSCKVFASLGIRRYLSALQYVTAVIGNSSSGILEVPSVHIPTLNIGERQHGRTKSESTVDCKSDKASVVIGLQKVLSTEFKNYCKTTANPYEKDGTAENIFKIISTYPLENLQRKKFYNL